MSTRAYEYGLEEVDARDDDDLIHAIDAPVHYMSVEFLRDANRKKPHVVFNFKTISPAELQATGDQKWKGCRVSMEYTGPGFRGQMQITLLPYMDSSYSATGAMPFPVINTGFTLRAVIDILRGRHPLNTRMANPPGASDFLSDLTKFDFVLAQPGSSDMDGCRDFICQSFVRLYEFGVVGCLGDGIANHMSYQNFSEMIPDVRVPGSLALHFGFYDIIHMNFVPVDPVAFDARKDNHVRPVEMPMHRGRFHDPRFQRRERMYVRELHDMRRLRYRESSQAGHQSMSQDGGDNPGPGNTGSGRGAGTGDPSAGTGQKGHQASQASSSHAQTGQQGHHGGGGAGHQQNPTARADAPRTVKKANRSSAIPIHHDERPHDKPSSSESRGPRVPVSAGAPNPTHTPPQSLGVKKAGTKVKSELIAPPKDANNNNPGSETTTRPAGNTLALRPGNTHNVPLGGKTAGDGPAKTNNGNTATHARGASKAASSQEVNRVVTPSQAQDKARTPAASQDQVSSTTKIARAVPRANQAQQTAKSKPLVGHGTPKVAPTIHSKLVST